MQLKRSLKSLKNKLTKKGEKMKWQWECLVKIQIPKIQAWFSCLAFGDHKIIPQIFCRANICTFPQQEHCFSRLKGNSQYEEYKELYDSKSEQSAVWLWHHLRDARRLVRRWNLPAGFLKSTISWLFDARGEWEIAQNTTLPGIAVSMKLPQQRSTKITQPHTEKLGWEGDSGRGLDINWWNIVLIVPLYDLEHLNVVTSQKTTQPSRPCLTHMNLWRRS